MAHSNHDSENGELNFPLDFVGAFPDFLFSPISCFSLNPL